jgi:hypothetical protein
MSLTSISDIKLDQDKGTVTYHKSYTVFPFSFPVYPESKMRFCLTIISNSQYLQTSRLFEFIRNAFPNFITLKNCSNLGDALKQLSDPNKSSDILSKQLAIFDLSSGNQFGKMIPDIIPASDDVPLHPLISHQMLRILAPNITFGKFQPNDSDRSYSYTIWIASKFSELPEIIRTNSHFTFITEAEDVKLYAEKYFHMDPHIPTDSIFSVCSTLTQDPQIMIVPKERFQVKSL